MHGGQKHASDSGDNYALGAETCLRSGGHLCTVGRNPPQIQGISLHGVHKRVSNLGQTFARCA